MLKRLITPFREFGLFAGVIYAIDRSFQRISPRLRLLQYDLLVQPLPSKPLVPVHLAGTYEVREILRTDPEIALMPARPEIKESRFAQNAICLGAFAKDKLVGYIWFCFHSYDEDEVRCTFVLPDGNDSVFDFDLYIFPDYRMGLAFAAIWNGAADYLRRKGSKFSFSRMAATNLASQRAHKHLGVRRIGRALFLRAWSLELMLASIVPYVHLSTEEKDRVCLKLRYS